MTDGAPNGAIVDLEAERLVLGAVLLDPQSWITVSASLDAQDFTDARNRLIFSAFSAIWRTSGTIDPVLVKAEMSKSRTLEMAGGFLYVAGLCDGLPRITNLGEWCSLLRSLRIRRQYVAKSDEIRHLALSGADLADLEAKALMLPRECRDLTHDNRVLSDTMAVYKTAIQELDRDIAGVETGVMTGLESLNRNLRGRGWQKSQLVYVGARTSMGKSALLLKFALGAAEQGKKVLFFTLEMPPEDLAQRHILSESRVDMMKLRRFRPGDYPEARQNAAEKVAAAFGRVTKAADFITFTDNRRRTVGRMYLEALKLREQDGLDLVIVDYLGYVKTTEKRRSLYEETTEKSHEMKALANELGLPVVCGVQLSRPPKTAKKDRPGLSSFREAGAIEEDADIGILIHQEGEHETIQTGETELIIAKQRNGWTGIARAWFEGIGPSFYDLADGYEMAGS